MRVELRGSTAAAIVCEGRVAAKIKPTLFVGSTNVLLYNVAKYAVSRYTVTHTFAYCLRSV